MQKTTLTITILLLITGLVAKAQQNPTPMHTPVEDKQAIQEAITSLFVGTDTRNWQQVHEAFAAEVRLDYTSLAGGEPATLTPEQITTGWKAVLPGFDHTHHALSNFLITVNGQEATATHYGNAEHYLEGAEDGNLWTVVGSYEYRLVKSSGHWKVAQMTLHFKYMTGNMNLPRYAQEKVAANNQ